MHLSPLFYEFINRHDATIILSMLNRSQKDFSPIGTEYRFPFSITLSGPQLIIYRKCIFPSLFHLRRNGLVVRAEDRLPCHVKVVFPNVSIDYDLPFFAFLSQGGYFTAVRTEDCVRYYVLNVTDHGLPSTAMVHFPKFGATIAANLWPSGLNI